MEFKSKELQTAAEVSSSITQPIHSIYDKAGILQAAQQYYAINNIDAYNKYVIGTIKGNKGHLHASEILTTIFRVISEYINDEYISEINAKDSKVYESNMILDNAVDILFSQIETDKEPQQIKEEVIALLLGILLKNI